MLRIETTVAGRPGNQGQPARQAQRAVAEVDGHGGTTVRAGQEHQGKATGLCRYASDAAGVQWRKRPLIGKLTPRVRQFVRCTKWINIIKQTFIPSYLQPLTLAA